jgi:hypothetical protein
MQGASIPSKNNETFRNQAIVALLELELECPSTIDILYTLDSASLLVKLKPRIFQRLPPLE